MKALLVSMVYSVWVGQERLAPLLQELLPGEPASAAQMIAGIVGLELSAP